MKKIAFIGSGELSIHIAHFIKLDTNFEIVGFYDDFREINSYVGEYKVIGRLDDILSDFNSKVFDELINGIGYTRMEYRKNVYNFFSKNIPFTTYIHSSCFVDPTAKIGNGVIIFPKCLIYYKAQIEDNVFIQVNTVLTDSIIRRHSMISFCVNIAGRAEIGECCNIGGATTIINDVKLCDYVNTGANAVVTKNINEPGLYVGMPAKKIK